MTKEIDIDSLKEKAKTYRQEILKVINKAGSGHPGGSLSAVEIFVTLYNYQMNHKPDDPTWEDRDFFVISKGHCSPVAYVNLAEQGYFPKEELETFRTLGARLQGHVTTGTPGIEFNTGSLGHGLSVCNGIAQGIKLRRKDSKVYCLLGDGEMQEGSNWEAAMSAAQFKLDNLCAIVDYNKVQENGPTNEIMNLEPLADKFRAFGWEVAEVIGHNFRQLIDAFDRFGKVPEKPYVIIAHTIKGKGVSFMEGDRNWHGKAPNSGQLEEALSELA